MTSELHFTLDSQAAFFREQGYVIIPEAVSADYLTHLQAAAERLLQEHPGVGTIRNILAFDPLFEEMIEGHAAFPLLEHLLGDIQLLAMDMRACFPGSGNMAWHTDIPFFSTSIVSINTALYLDALTPHNGTLRLVPRSHLFPFDLPVEQREAALPGELRVECPAGTMIVFSDCLWHRTGANTTNRPRRGIFTYYGHYWIKQCSYAEKPQPLRDMRQYIDGKGTKRAQLMGVWREGSEFNVHPHSNRACDTPSNSSHV